MAEKVKAQAKYIRISPRKVRQVLDLIKRKPVKQALALLKFMPQKGARVVEKVIKSAAANAKHNYKLNQDKLIISAATADQAAIMKRFQPVSRGRAHPIKKRFSHVTIFVSEKA